VVEVNLPFPSTTTVTTYAPTTERIIGPSVFINFWENAVENDP